MQQAIGRAVRRLRKQAGLTQEELANELGIHRTYIGALERAEKNLSLQTYEDLCIRLGVHPISLLVEPTGEWFSLTGDDRPEATGEIVAPWRHRRPRR